MQCLMLWMDTNAEYAKKGKVELFKETQKLLKM